MNRTPWVGSDEWYDEHYEAWLNGLDVPDEHRATDEGYSGFCDGAEWGAAWGMAIVGLGHALHDRYFQSTTPRRSGRD